jgi:hypothetical protein
MIPLGTRWLGMATQGAEVVFGDLDDIDSLKRGFTGAYGVYGITDCKCLVGFFSLCPTRTPHPTALVAWLM